MSHPLLRRLMIAATTAGLFALIAAAATDAHVLKDFGSYSVALGWVTEPTYVGQVNAVQVVIKDKQGKAITDVPDGDLKVVVSAGDQTSASLSLNNKFDADTGLGVPGDYEAPLTPTVPGDYTFHLTGTVHGQAIDETATSSDSTFDSAVEATDIEFPTKLPSLSEVVTRLDRIDSRLAASPGPGAVANPARAMGRAVSPTCQPPKRPRRRHAMRRRRRSSSASSWAASGSFSGRLPRG